MIELTQKLKKAMKIQKITQTQLGEATFQTQNNLANKLKGNNFRVQEYQKLVEALGCELELNIIFPNGEKL